MIRIGLVGDIGSGKSHIAKKFRYPVFNADNEVNKIYRTDKSCFFRLNKILPNYINSFPIKKIEILRAILAKKSNLKKIIKIVHPKIKKKLNIFLNKNKDKKIVILDIPLLLENKINKKNDILIFVKSEKKEITKRLKKMYNEKKNRKYVGDIRNGGPNGQGTLTSHDGRIEVGVWRENQPWNNIEYDKNGNTIGKWVNGVEQ